MLNRQIRLNCPSRASPPARRAAQNLNATETLPLCWQITWTSVHALPPLGGQPQPNLLGRGNVGSAHRLLPTASAAAITHFRGSIAHPTRLLCTLRPRRRHRRYNTHYQAGATPYPGRTCTGWIAPASPGAPEVGSNIHSEIW